MLKLEIENQPNGNRSPRTRRQPTRYRYPEKGNVKLTVAEGKPSDCKKSVAELEKRVARLENEVRHLNTQSLILFVMALCGLLGLLGLFMARLP